MDWKWAENSILNNTSQYRPCKDIFQSMADELGRYYENKGLKYSHSFPKLVYKDSCIKLEILFASSHSNRKGDYVCFDFRNNKNEPNICVWSSKDSMEFEPVTFSVANSFTEFIRLLE